MTADAARCHHSQRSVGWLARGHPSTHRDATLRGHPFVHTWRFRRPWRHKRSGLPSWVAQRLGNRAFAHDARDLSIEQAGPLPLVVQQALREVLLAKLQWLAALQLSQSINQNDDAGRCQTAVDAVERVSRFWRDADLAEDFATIDRARQAMDGDANVVDVARQQSPLSALATTIPR